MSVIFRDTCGCQVVHNDGAWSVHIERCALHKAAFKLHAALCYVHRILQAKANSEYGLDAFEVDRCLRKLDVSLAENLEVE